MFQSWYTLGRLGGFNSLNLQACLRSALGCPDHAAGARGTGAVVGGLLTVCCLWGSKV